MIKKIIICLVIISTCITFKPINAEAIDTSLNAFINGGTFNKLIADDAFTATNSMSVSSIQQLLVLKKSYLRTFSENGRSAAQIIYDAAHGNGGATYTLNGIDINIATGTVSPKVLIATLEKEQGLIASNLSPSQRDLDCAMGYEWGNGCNWMFTNKPGLKGFTNQVESAAWQLRYNFEAAKKDLNWWSDNYAGSSYYYVGLNTDMPNSTGGSYNVTFTNAATASLYRYTPYVLNGNFNFWKIYNDYFGNFLNLSVNPKTLGSISTQGISCADNCSLSFPTGSNMSLVANNTLGSEFASWKGCDSTKGNVCSIFFNQERYIEASFSQSLATRTVYYSGAGKWDFNRITDMVSGDFNGDGTDEIAVMYDYGQNNMGIIVFTKNSQGVYSPKLAFSSGTGKWNLGRTKGLVAGNFGGDTKTDLAVMYDYGLNNTGIWTFISDGISFSPILKYSSGNGNWNYERSKFIASGNFRGDSLSDIAIAYDYGNNTMRIWSMTTNSGKKSSTPQMIYDSGVGNWKMTNSKGFLSGEFGGDNLSDLSLLYDYGDNNTGIWQFITNSTINSTPRLVYNSGKGNWSFERSRKLVAGYFEDGIIENVGIIYDYGNNQMRLWIKNGRSFEPWYNSGPDSWDCAKSKDYITGNFFGANDNMIIAYDYGNNTLGFTAFTQTGKVFSQ